MSVIGCGRTVASSCLSTETHQKCSLCGKWSNLSASCCSTVQQVLIYSDDKEAAPQRSVPCIRAMHIPGELSRVTYNGAKGGSCQEAWSLHPRLISQIQARFGRGKVNVFPAHRNTVCSLVVPEHMGQAPVGSGCICALAMARAFVMFPNADSVIFGPGDG